MKLPTLKFEKKLWNQGYQFVCGIDEVGRGAWAGPVVAAAVIFKKKTSSKKASSQDYKIGIRDSKQLRPEQREKLDAWIRKNCFTFCISEISVKTINREGIGRSSQRAFRKCLKLIMPKPDFILMDAFYIKNLSKKNQLPIVKGDQKSLSIAAASIIAKVYRDNLMKQLHQKDHRYHFDQHKGYGTQLHQQALKKHGPSPHHRLAFISHPPKIDKIASSH